MVTQKYIRLLSYEEACLLIDFVNSKKGDNYANITAGGVSISIMESLLPELKKFCDKHFKRFEISDNHPMKTEGMIVEKLKNTRVI